MTQTRELPAELTIYTAAESHGVLLAWLESDPPPVTSGAWSVQGAGVSQVDAAGLQLLVALNLSLRARDQSLVIAEPSESLRHACASLGLTALLQCEPVCEVSA